MPLAASHQKDHAAAPPRMLARLYIPSLPPSALVRSRSCIWIALVVLLAGLLSVFVTQDAACRAWIFPSQQITWSKVLGLLVGLALSASFFTATRAQWASAEVAVRESAAALVSPMHREHADKPREHAAPIETETTQQSWLAARFQSLFRMQHFGRAEVDAHADADANANTAAPTEDAGADADAADAEAEVQTEPPRVAEMPWLQIRDECKTGAEWHGANQAIIVPIETDWFQGRAVFLIRNSRQEQSTTPPFDELLRASDSLLRIQMQGRAVAPPSSSSSSESPTRTVLFLAGELGAVDALQASLSIWTKPLLHVLIAVARRINPGIHIALGEPSSSSRRACWDGELPHVAVPLFQSVDEWVVTPATETPPVLGSYLFGETEQQQQIRKATPIGMEPPLDPDATYSFQYFTSTADLAEWQIANVPGVSQIDIQRFIGQHALRLAIYALQVPRELDLTTQRHAAATKHYAFCYSFAHGTVDPSPVPPPQQPQPQQRSRTRPPLISASSIAAVTPRSGTDVSAVATRAADFADPQNAADHSREDTEEVLPQPRIRAAIAIRSMTAQERAADLAHWRFALHAWIEMVDPMAGNRKVAYLFTVARQASEEDATRASTQPRTVIRTAKTVKNAVLALEPASDGRTDDSSYAQAFRRLAVQSREYLYETITDETKRVANALQEIAEEQDPPLPTATTTPTDRIQTRQAMLYNCLMSEAQLPRIPSRASIGVLASPPRSSSSLDRVVLEIGVYRLMAPMFLRQEWMVVTARDVQFFRSYSLRTSRIVARQHILAVRAVDHADFLNDHEPDENAEQHVATLQRDATNTWHALQVHLLDEIVTLFVDSQDARAQCLASLQDVTVSAVDVGSSTGSSSSSSSCSSGPRRSLDTLSTRKCLNRKNLLGPRAIVRESNHAPPLDLSSLSCLALVEELLARALVVRDKQCECMDCIDVLRFLEAVEYLNELDLRGPAAAEELASDAARLAFAVNLSHVLYLHAMLLFGAVTTTAQWQKLKTKLFYAIGGASNTSDQTTSICLSLAEIEDELLTPRPLPTTDDPSAIDHDADADPALASSSIPSHLRMQHREFRTSLVLQLNVNPRLQRLVRVYHADPIEQLNEELDDTCARFLATQVEFDLHKRVIILPRICQTYAADFTAVVSGASEAVVGSTAFVCLQRLLPLMNATQQQQVRHLLLGAGNEPVITYAPFWTVTSENAERASRLWRWTWDVATADNAHIS